MLSFITADQNLPFSFALAFMLMIALLEIIGMVIGVGFSELLDGMFPDMDMDVDVDADLDAADADIPVLSMVLGWFRIGQVPVLILMIVFLTCFGLVGYAVQKTAGAIIGTMLPAWLAALVAFFVSLPFFRVTSGVIGKIAPKDETTAVSDDTFIGRVATITIGHAAKDSPAEAKLQDKFDQTHYIMVAPDLDDESFKQGEQVLLVRKTGSIFRVIAADNPALQDN